MEFQTVTSTDEVAQAIAERVRLALEAGSSVLWLLSGGSAVAIQVAASKLLDGLDLSALTIGLTDERYGAVGFPDSNWQQTIEAGFMFGAAQTHPTLTGTAIEQTTLDESEWFEQALNDFDYKLGFFGMGPDGHIAGILPGSPAVHEPSFACGYDGGEFQRVTMAPAAIARLDEAILFAAGEAKRPMLTALKHDELSVDQQPAQLLKRVKRVTVYTDQKDI